MDSLVHATSHVPDLLYTCAIARISICARSVRVQIDLRCRTSRPSKRIPYTLLYMYSFQSNITSRSNKCGIASRIASRLLHVPSFPIPSAHNPTRDPSIRGSPAARHVPRTRTAGAMCASSKRPQGGSLLSWLTPFWHDQVARALSFRNRSCFRGSAWG